MAKPTLLWLALASVATAATASPTSSEAFTIPDGWTTAPDNTADTGAAGFRILHETLGLEMVWVPGGTFAMGGRHIPKTRIDDEAPVHEVHLDGYWIGRTEITATQWRAVMQRVPDLNDRGEDHPVVNLTWHDAVAFCRRAGVALPTEAQWEYAARGPKGFRFPWGDDWVEGHSFYRARGAVDAWTAPAGARPTDRSWCGAMDMGGNAWEWCHDWYAADYYAWSPHRNPRGPETGTRRVVRGATFEYLRYPHDWRAGGRLCRAEGRDWQYPDRTGGIYGLRVVLPANPAL